MKFTQTGTTVLTASVTDGLGRAFTYEQTIKVYPVLHLKRTADAAAHTDEQISVMQEKDTALPVTWEITPSNDPATAVEYTSDLTDNGGTSWYKGWQTADEYLSGNVRKKLIAARAAAEKYPGLAVNAEKLEQVQPKELTAAEIDVHKLGSFIKRKYPRTGYSAATSVRGLATDSAQGTVAVPGLSRLYNSA